MCAVQNCVEAETVPLSKYLRTTLYPACIVMVACLFSHVSARVLGAGAGPAPDQRRGGAAAAAGPGYEPRGR